MNIAKKENHLPETLKDKIEFVNIGVEKLVAYRAMARAAMKKGDLTARKQIMGAAQTLAGDLLDTEAAIGDALKQRQHRGGISIGRSSPGGTSNPLPEGINKKQSHIFQTMAAHKDIVEQVKAEAKDNDDLPTRTEVLRKVKEQENEKRHEELKNKKIEIPKGIFEVIYADPPWAYDTPQSTKPVDHHYPTMELDELIIFGEKIKNISHINCVLYLWTTSARLDWAFPVIEACVFKYKSSMIWDKIKHNLGWYSSVRHEILLIAGKGSSSPKDSKKANSFDSVCSIERSDRHSEKPIEFGMMINSLYPNNKKIEFFCRMRKEYHNKTWEITGNEL